MICKYKFQDGYHYNGKPFCTCFSELCENLPICDDNCQIFEDLKELERYKQAVNKIKTWISEVKNVDN